MALDPLTAALGIGDKLIGHFFPDKAQQDAAKLQLLQLAQQGDLTQITGQMDINKAEAANPNMFVAGWRPFMGWVGGCAFAFNFVIGPLAAQVSQWTHRAFVYTPIDMTTMMPVIVGMLGLGAYRTYEKVTGTEGNRS